MAVQDSARDEADWAAFTIRLPRTVHEWLRCEAFFQRTTMSEIVRKEIAARMASSRTRRPEAVYDEAPVAVGETTGPIGIVKA